jgi:putative endonuclease
MSKQSVGMDGEDLAAAYLEGLGYRVMERNYRFERAEVDLICFEPTPDNAGGQLVFVEVKTRTGTGYGRPEEAITHEKQRNMLRAAEAFLHERRLDGSPCRFDVVAIILKGEGREIQHFRDAFWIFDLLPGRNP